MTSHDLAPDGLPYIVPGMIWDGVTEYHNRLPPDVPASYLLRMYGDGTRRFSESTGTGDPMQHLRLWTGRGWEQIGVTFMDPGYPIDYRNGAGFLGYDGVAGPDPANQLFYTNQFKAHAARSAHRLDLAMGARTLSSADKVDSEIIRQTIEAVIGSAARRYAEWEVIDPETLIVGGNFDGTPLWRHHERTLQDYIDIDEGLCGACKGSMFPRQMRKKADLAAFRAEWRQGLIYTVDRTTTPWSPLLFDAPPPGMTTSEFHDVLDEYLGLMHDHYDDVIGPAEEAKP